MSTIRKNPFKPLYEMCNAGNSREKFASLPRFPRFIDVEMTNTCNFRCLMCPTGNHSMTRKSGFMSKEVFYRILDQVAPHKTPLRFIMWGEPTLHPDLLEFLSAAHAHGVMTHLNSNGSKMDRAFIEKLIASGLDSIKFSFQGVDKKSYAEMRNTDFFLQLVEVIRLFREVRGNRDRPYLHVSTSITYETKEQVRDFRELMADLADEVSIGRTVFHNAELNAVRLRPAEMEMLKQLKDQESVVHEHPECPEVYDKMSINWDGTVLACCDDPNSEMALGSVMSSTIGDLWLSDQLNFYREMLADMRHDELPRCKTCFDYQSLTIPGLQSVD